MIKINTKMILLGVFTIVLQIKALENKREGRDYGYYPPDDDKRQDYQPYQYPAGYYSVRDECEKNPMLPFLGKAVNFLLLKLGVFGVIKATLVIVFLALLAKIPLLMLKMAFLKSFFVPFLFIPLLLPLLSAISFGASGGNKPVEPSPGTDTMMSVMDTMNTDKGRELADNLTSTVWQSVKMFAESDKCVERISCLIGASNNDSSMGMIYSRMLKFLHYSSPRALQDRVASVKEAFNKGITTSVCSDEEYKCQNPELVVQQGVNRIKIL